MERDFPRGGPAPIYLAVQAPAQPPGEDLARYVEDLQELEGVRALESPRSVDAGLWRIDVQPAGAPLSADSRELVADVRAVAAPFPVEVGGRSARFHDQGAALIESLPTVAAVVLESTMILLLLATGSVLLPFKQLANNALAVAATFGVLVWIFQRGHLENLLGFDSMGAIGIAEPAVIVVLVFALSTDYGVFLLSRIREERENGHANREAVARGVGKTGGIVTAAAVLFAVAVGAFSTSEIVFVKILGLGAALAVLLDATVIRAFLVPSLMAVLGPWNWWAPEPLRAV